MDYFRSISDLVGKNARNSIPAFLRGIRSCLCVVAIVQLVLIFSTVGVGAPQEAIAQAINQTGKSTIRSGRDARAPGEHPAASAAVKTRTKGCCDGMKMADASPAPTKTADENPASTRKEVMDPSRFVGMAGIGYASAKACPEVMEKLFCYCGCDLTDKHTSLLDCFASIHGLDCHICQEEAVLANKMHNDGASVQEIQKTIDEKYVKDYPFQEDTPAYKQYKSARYLKDSDKPTKFGKEAAGPEAPEDKTAHKTPKLKPGKKAGQCCSSKDHKHDEQPSDSSKSDK